VDRGPRLLGYEPDVQLLANRGYAVLQVNFRGSTGYGKSFVKAAIGEFAGKMHDDLIDAVNWAVDEGTPIPLASRSSVALTVVTPRWSARRSPRRLRRSDRLRRNLSLVNFEDAARRRAAAPGQQLAPVRRQPGHPGAGSRHARPLPITRVDQIRTPLLVVQGANDSRVVQAESDNLVEALRARGVEVEYMVKDDEGHGFVNDENVIDLYRAVERFLAEHLGGRRS
jgi:pimeloyl-ACP methyl ester carboxylesterase